MKKEGSKYFIRQYSQSDYRHGGVGYADAERILLKKGFMPVEFPYYEDFSLLAKISRFFYLARILSRIKKGSVVVFLFPVYARIHRLLLRILLRRDVKLICFVADINGIKDADQEGLAEEIRFLKRFRYFIVHNEGMKQWLQQRIPRGYFAPIEFFDFLAIPAATFREISGDIVFAGNLEKSPFLEKLHLLDTGSSSLRFHLYGPGQTQAMLTQKNVSWHGVENPYELPARLNGSFGLLWDDACIEKPCGGYGDYMQYISHHKLSLYILSRLPVIVPAIAASAPLVKKYKIGFSVNSLYEIEEKIKAISASDHLQMQQNMAHLAHKISTGGCLEEALGSVLQSNSLTVLQSGS